MPTDILDDLLAEALQIELRSRRGQGSVRRLRQIREICTQSLHCETSWRKSRTILLLHNEVGALGYFDEFIHKSTLARQLHRLTEEPSVTPEIEIVSGPEWLGGPRFHLVDPPTEAEITRIRELYRPRLVRYPWKHLKGKRRFGPIKTSTRSADQILKDLCA